MAVWGDSMRQRNVQDEEEATTEEVVEELEVFLEERFIASTGFLESHPDDGEAEAAEKDRRCRLNLAT